MTLGFLKKLASTIEKINEARMEVESFFNGLPHAHTTLIKSLINSANPVDGCVENCSYNDLIDLLKVTKAPGRKNANIQKQTIRSYLKTIVKLCPEHFQVVSEGQQLIIKFGVLQATECPIV